VNAQHFTTTSLHNQAQHFTSLHFTTKKIKSSAGTSQPSGRWRHLYDLVAVFCLFSRFHDLHNTFCTNATPSPRDRQQRLGPAPNSLQAHEAPPLDTVRPPPERNARGGTPLSRARRGARSCELHSAIRHGPPRAAGGARAGPWHPGGRAPLVPARRRPGREDAQGGHAPPTGAERTQLRDALGAVAYVPRRCRHRAAGGVPPRRPPQPPAHSGDVAPRGVRRAAGRDRRRHTLTTTAIAAAPVAAELRPYRRRLARRRLRADVGGRKGLLRKAAARQPGHHLLPR
jgi:hypothetical protein